LPHSPVAGEAGRARAGPGGPSSGVYHILIFKDGDLRVVSRPPMRALRRRRARGLYSAAVRTVCPCARVLAKMVTGEDLRVRAVSLTQLQGVVPTFRDAVPKRHGESSASSHGERRKKKGGKLPQRCQSTCRSTVPPERTRAPRIPAVCPVSWLRTLRVGENRPHLLHAGWQDVAGRAGKFIDSYLIKTFLARLFRRALRRCSEQASLCASYSRDSVCLKTSLTASLSLGSAILSTSSPTALIPSAKKLSGSPMNWNICL